MLACNLPLRQMKRVMEKAYAMFFIVRGSKGEDVAAAVRLRAVNAVAKARDLGFLGWQVFIECGDGNRYYPGEFDRRFRTCDMKHRL
jgi:hypothetical protein